MAVIRSESNPFQTRRPSAAHLLRGLSVGQGARASRGRETRPEACEKEGKGSAAALVPQTRFPQGLSRIDLLEYRDMLSAEPRVDALHALQRMSLLEGAQLLLESNGADPRRKLPSAGFSNYLHDRRRRMTSDILASACRYQSTANCQSWCLDTVALGLTSIRCFPMDTRISSAPSVSTFSMHIAADHVYSSTSSLRRG